MIIECIFSISNSLCLCSPYATSHCFPEKFLHTFITCIDLLTYLSCLASSFPSGRGRTWVGPPHTQLPGITVLGIDFSQLPLLQITSDCFLPGLLWPTRLFLARYSDGPTFVDPAMASLHMAVPS